MQNIYKQKFLNLRKEEDALVRECLDKIVEVCDKNNGIIEFGNTTIIAKVDELDEEQKRVPFIVTDKIFTPLYSDDGYTEIDDIANWADIAEDWHNSRQAGNVIYSQDWNLKKEM